MSKRTSTYKKDEGTPNEKTYLTDLISVYDIDGPDKMIQTFDLHSSNHAISARLKALPEYCGISARVTSWRTGEFNTRLRFDVVGFEVLGQQPEPRSAQQETDEIPL